MRPTTNSAGKSSIPSHSGVISPTNYSLKLYSLLRSPDQSLVKAGMVFLIETVQCLSSPSTASMFGWTLTKIKSSHRPGHEFASSYSGHLFRATASSEWVSTAVGHFPSYKRCAFAGLFCSLVHSLFSLAPNSCQ